MNKIKILFALMFLSFCSISSYAQKTDYPEPQVPIDADTKIITYTKVIDLTANKDSLYKKGLQWFNKYYKNPTSVIKEQDPANGKILGKHQFKVLNPADKNGIQTMKAIILYTITTQYKENKARIVITDINISSTSYTPVEKWLDKNAPDFSNKNYFYIEQINKQLTETVSNFESFIKSSAKQQNNNW